MVKKLYRKRLDPFRSRVQMGIGPVEGGKLCIKFVVDVHLGVRGPQVGEHLHNVKNSVAYRWSPDQSVTEAEPTVVDPEHKHSENGDFVREIPEERVREAKLG